MSDAKRRKKKKKRKEKKKGHKQNESSSLSSFDIVLCLSFFCSRETCIL